MVILGHNGFIGRHLVARLERNENVSVVDGASLPGCDLTRMDQVERLRPQFTPETVLIICAARKRQLGDHLDAYDENAGMITNLCRVLQDSPPLARVIFFSSAAVYGEEHHDVNITEETAIRPTSYYGGAKFAGECLLRKTLEPRTEVVALRPALVFGPGDGAMYGPSGFVRSALDSRTIALWGDGSERREFVYVEDVAEIVSRLVDHPFSGVINVVNGRSDTFQEVVGLIRYLVPDLEVTTRPRSKSQVDHGFNNSLLRKLCPDLRFTPLAEAVENTWRAAKESGLEAAVERK